MVRRHWWPGEKASLLQNGTKLRAACGVRDWAEFMVGRVSLVNCGNCRASRSYKATATERWMLSIPCPACGGAGTRDVYSRRGLKCSRCNGLGRVLEHPAVETEAL
jgi:DnaJ-class molecular chaperone